MVPLLFGFYFIHFFAISFDLDFHVISICIYMQVKIMDSEAQGFNPGLIVLIVVGGLLFAFLGGNYALYAYAQKNLPPRKKKPVSKKKLKKEKLKQGVAPAGE